MIWMILGINIIIHRMGALPWTLRTSGNSSNKPTHDGPKVITSESSPLPKSSKGANHQEEKGRPRRGSLGDIHKSIITVPIITANEEDAAITDSPTGIVVEEEEAKEEEEKVEEEPINTADITGAITPADTTATTIAN
jgi:hypothetical protein